MQEKNDQIARGSIELTQIEPLERRESNDYLITNQSIGYNMNTAKMSALLQTSKRERAILNQIEDYQDDAYSNYIKK